MTTARVISWILGNGIFAYIYMPDGQSQIGNKILENSPLWVDIVKEVGTWGEEKYKEAYENLSNIVSGKGYTLPPYDVKFFDGGVNLEGYKLALLSGVGGLGGGSGSGGGSGVGPSDGVDGGIDYSEFEKFIEDLDRELKKAREELEKKAEEIKQYIENEFNETYFDAKAEIQRAKEELNRIREDLEKKLQDAKDALDAAKKALGDGKIDPEEMEAIFLCVQEYSDWMKAYSGVVTSLKNEYDEVNGQMGSIGEAEDASAGLFAKFATCINILSDTVGNVHSWMVASSATIGQMASWYDVNASSATEVIRYMSASAKQITDTINYIYGEGEDAITAKLERKMDAKDGFIRDEILYETSGSIISLSSKIDAINGQITDKISYLAPSGALVSMGEQMDAMNYEMTQWMTKINDLSGTAIDLRDEWSEASGKLSTVSNLMAETDKNGNILYFTSGGTRGEDNWYEKTVIRVGDKWLDAESQTQEYDANKVYAKYSAVMYSWFQQQAERIEMGIKDELKDLSAGITMSFSGDEAFIKMVASKVVIDAQLIAEAISAKTANIGGIMIGSGIVESVFTSGGNPAFKLNSWNGQVYSQNLLVNGKADLCGDINIGGDAKIVGDITATSLTLGAEYGDKSIKDYIDEQIPSGTEVNTSFTSEEEDGKTKHTITIGDKEYVWYTYELTDVNGDGFIMLDRPYPTGADIKESGKTSVMISKNGLLQANNAVIYGCVYANDGEIGGLKLNNSRLMVSRNGNYNDSIAYLNGSNTYYDSERGTIILAAGISSGCTYHKYTSLESTSYSTIYTKKKYLTENGDESGCEVEAYEYNTLTQTYTKLENQFYFLTAKSTEQSSEDDILTKDSDGNDIFIKQYVVRKYYIQTGHDGDLDEEVDEYSYAGTVSAKEAVVNTRIFEDGTIISNTLVANDGYFGGEINAIGKFRGTLENVGGTLKGVTIDANLINGNIVIRNSDSIKAKSNNQLYFSVGKEPLSDNSTKEYWNVDEFFWERKNSNGTNAGQYYNDWSTIAYVPFKSGATITIPALEGSIYRYAADGRTNNASYLWVECSVLYDGSTTEETLIRKTITAGSHGHSSKPTHRITTGEGVFTMEKDGILSVTFGYNVHLSTYAWLNADKSYAKVKFNTGGSKIIVEYPKSIEGVSIASNGMRVLNVSGASLSVIGEKITLLSPNKKYGLRITDSGVQIRRDSTDETKWVNL